LAEKAVTDFKYNQRDLLTSLPCPGPQYTQPAEALALTEVFLSLAGHNIALPDAKETLAYLADKPQLAQLLPNIYAEVRQALGPDVELSLEVYKDREDDDPYLTLYVRKDKYEHNILDHLQAVSEGFNHRLEEVPGYLLLTTDFSQPRGTHAV
jgi:hypothetical protein